MKQGIEKEIIEIVSKSHEETSLWGERLAKLLEPGDVVALYGELGSGKTVFIQGICKGLGVRDYVTSPSFTLIQEYMGDVPVFHLDFYRLESNREIEALNIESTWESGSIALVEWAERGERQLPEGRFQVFLHRVQENGHFVLDERMIRMIAPVGKIPTSLRS